MISVAWVHAVDESAVVAEGTVEVNVVHSEGAADRSLVKTTYELVETGDDDADDDADADADADVEVSDEVDSDSSRSRSSLWYLRAALNSRCFVEYLSRMDRLRWLARTAGRQQPTQLDDDDDELLDDSTVQKQLLDDDAVVRSLRLK